MATGRSLVRPALITFIFISAFLLYFNASHINGYLRTAGWRKTGGASSLSPQAGGEELSQSNGVVPDNGDKVIVMGRLQREDTSWVQEHLPDWQNAIYTVDNTSAPLSTPRNKGREANPYLLYIIQNYHNLPSTIAFLHSHRDTFPGGWHTDAPGVDNVVAIRTLNLEFVQRNGYANMRCQWYPGCPDWVQPLRSLESDDPDDVEHFMNEAWREIFGVDIDIPEVIATPCCAQFAVSKEQVLKRPLKEYEGYHQWLMNTEMSDQMSGRIFEYLWHIIFGQGPVYCPELAQCYRDVYNREYNATEWEMEKQRLIDVWNSTHS